MSECIEWEGYRHKDGYGRRSVGGKVRQAHRVAWEAVHGDIPEGHCVCHSCDNPPCVNVEHLFLGTHRDNMKDMNNKGRRAGPAGETHHDAKLTDEQVWNVRRNYAYKVATVLEMSREFCISCVALYAIINNKTRKEAGTHV